MASDTVARLHRIDLPETLECAYIYPIGDLHLGDPHHDPEKLYRYLKFVRETDNAYIILNGDLANIATANSVSDTYSETCSVRDQRKQLVKMFTPVRDRILGCTGGNHEHRIYRETGEDFTEVIATLLDIPYFEDEMWLKVSLGRYSQHGKSQKPVVYSVYATHGFGGGRNAFFGDFDGRQDADVNLFWELQNLGLADKAIADGPLAHPFAFQDRVDPGADLRDLIEADL